MTNTLYPLYKQALITESAANAGLDQLDPNAPYLALMHLAGGYVYNSSHQFFTDLTNIIGTPVALTGTSVLNGLFRANTAVFAGVTGASFDGLVIYRQSSLANSNWRLVLYEDLGIIGLPITPNGGNIIITWDVAGVFQL